MATRRNSWLPLCFDLEAFLQSLITPAPSLEEEGSGDTQGISVADWNAISAEWAGFLSRDRKNDVDQLP